MLMSPKALWEKNEIKQFVQSKSWSLLRYLPDWLKTQSKVLNPLDATGRYAYDRSVKLLMWLQQTSVNKRHLSIDQLCWISLELCRLLKSAIFIHSVHASYKQSWTFLFYLFEYLSAELGSECVSSASKPWWCNRWVAKDSITLLSMLSVKRLKQQSL